jgi:hypothetical protein
LSKNPHHRIQVCADYHSNAADAFGEPEKDSSWTARYTICSSVIEPAKGSVLSKPLTLTAMSLGWGVVQLDVTIVNTALESIGTSLGGGVSQLQWVVSIYTVAFASLILTAGALGVRIADRASGPFPIRRSCGASHIYPAAGRGRYRDRLAARRTFSH